MSKPTHPPIPQNIQHPRTFFLTTSTAEGRCLLQSQRMANLLIEVLRDLMRKRKMTVHEFVVMPNHVHVLATLPPEMPLDRAMQLIKGGFSFRAKKETSFKGEIWQRGYSDVLVPDRESFKAHTEYIHNNPVKAGLVSLPEEFQYGSLYLKHLKAAELH